MSQPIKMIFFIRFRVSKSGQLPRFKRLCTKTIEVWSTLLTTPTPKRFTIGLYNPNDVIKSASFQLYLGRGWVSRKKYNSSPLENTHYNNLILEKHILELFSQSLVEFIYLCTHIIDCIARKFATP